MIIGVEKIEREAAGHVQLGQSDAFVHAHALGARRLYGAYAVRLEYLGFRPTNPEHFGPRNYSGECEQSYTLCVCVCRISWDKNQIYQTPVNSCKLPQF
jgi:hypothetical protein